MSHVPTLVVLMALAAAALWACAPMTWARPGTSAEMAAADQTECRAIAYRQADALAFHRGYASSLFHWRHGRYVYDPDPFLDSPFDDTFFLARDLARECLRAKGYRLVPVEAQG